MGRGLGAGNSCPLSMREATRTSKMTKNHREPLYATNPAPPPPSCAHFELISAKQLLLGQLQTTFTEVGEKLLPQILALVPGAEQKSFSEDYFAGQHGTKKAVHHLQSEGRQCCSCLNVWLLYEGKAGPSPHPPGSSVAMCIIHLKTNAGQGCCGQLTKADQQITSLAFPLALPLLLLLLLLFLGQ